MTRTRTAALAAWVLTLAACASAPVAPTVSPAPAAPDAAQSPTAPAAATTTPAPGTPAQPNPGRFMQIRHPLYGTVLVQVGFPTPQACASAARLLASDKSAGTPCADTSAGAQLLAIATVRDNAGPTLYQVEASTTPLCETFVTDMLAAARGGLTLVADCKQK